MNESICNYWSIVEILANLISSLVAVVLAYNAYKMAKENRRARLVATLTQKENLLYIKMSNVGHQTANNVRVKLGGKPIEENLIPDVKRILENLHTKSFSIEPGKSSYFLLCGIEDSGSLFYIFKTKGKACPQAHEVKEWLKAHGEDTVNVSLKYCNVHEDEFKLKMSDYFNIEGLAYNNCSDEDFGKVKIEEESK